MENGRGRKFLIYGRGESTDFLTGVYNIYPYHHSIAISSSLKRGRVYMNL